MARQGKHRMKLNKTGRKTLADERAVERAARSPQQQLARLDTFLGVGLGAKKERARLAPKPVVSRVSGIETTISVSAPGFTANIDGKTIPIQSISQIRRLGAQYEVDTKPLIKGFKEFLAKAAR